MLCPDTVCFDGKRQMLYALTDRGDDAQGRRWCSLWRALMTGATTPSSSTSTRALLLPTPSSTPCASLTFAQQCPPRLNISQKPQQASVLTAGRQFRGRQLLRVSCRKLRRCAMARPRSFKMPRGGHCHHALSWKGRTRSRTGATERSTPSQLSGCVHTRDMRVIRKALYALFHCKAICEIQWHCNVTQCVMQVSNLCSGS